MWLRAIAVVAVLGGLAVAARAAEEQAGVGIALDLVDDEFFIIKILPDTPAFAARLLNVGDRVVAVTPEDGPPVEIHGKTMSQVVALIRGPEGTKVRLTVVPDGEEDSHAFDVRLTRALIKQAPLFTRDDLLPVGMPAPDVLLRELAGERRFRLSELAGQVVVLKFWATWCASCQPQMAEFQKYPAEHADWKGRVTLLSVSIDESREEAAKHIAEKRWTATGSTWADEGAVQAFKLSGVPTTYVIDRTGRIAAGDPAELADVVEALLKAK